MKNPNTSVPTVTASAQPKRKRVIAYRPLQRKYKPSEDPASAVAKEATMRFSDFVDLYLADMTGRWKPSTSYKRESMIRSQLVAHFGDMRLNEITPIDIRAWQRKMMDATTTRGAAYSHTYIRQLQAELACIFNYAIKFYNLPENPCAKAGTVTKDAPGEMQFWTAEEFRTFICGIEDHKTAYIAFTMLYYTGLREGELLALTPSDINLSIGTLSVTKTYQRIHREDVITTPKTPKSNRTVTLPATLCDVLRDYMREEGPASPNDRLFPCTKDFLYREMRRGCEKTGVKRIRVHDLRHSHASLLVELGFSPLLIAERLGHETVQTTLNIYSHLYPNKQAEVAGQLNGLMQER